MKKSLLILLFVLPVLAFGQSPLQLSIFGGVSNYQGDLQPKRITMQQSNLALGIGLKYELTPALAIRGEVRYGQLEATDKLNGPRYVARNLSFHSKLYEASGLFEYSFLDLFDNSMTPYIFAGGALYHFSPYTYDTNGVKRFLQPLGTEGQGLAAYPDGKMYKLTQFAIPFGGGIRVQANELVTVGFEVGARKTFTDYLDDVSTTYADEQTLIAGRGARSADLAYRGDELKNGAPYPVAGTVRGGKHKDWYYFAGVTVSIRLFDLGRSPFEKSVSSKYKMGCPPTR